MHSSTLDALGVLGKVVLVDALDLGLDLLYFDLDLDNLSFANFSVLTVFFLLLFSGSFLTVKIFSFLLLVLELFLIHFPLTQCLL